jgi:integrase
MESLKVKRDKERYERTLFNFNASNLSDKNKQLILNYINLVTHYRKNKSVQPYGVNTTRILILKRFCEYVKKDLDKVTNFDLIRFAMDLDQDIFKSERGKPYSLGYKEKFSKMINSFYTYHYGKDKETLNNLILDQFGKKILSFKGESQKEKPVLTYNQIKLIIEKSESLEEMFFISCLFDGGFRIEEFLNIRFCDVEEKKGEKQRYYIFKVTQGTKTGKSRLVGLYNFPNVIQRYLDVFVKKGYKTTDYLFQYTPQYCNRLIKLMLIKYLGFSEEEAKKYHNHSLRHSSATYYAVYVAKREAEIYRRFGWSFGSKEAREYIQMLYVNDSQEEQNFRQTAVSEETKQYKEELNILKYKLEQQQKQLDFLSKALKELSEL